MKATVSLRAIIFVLGCCAPAAETSSTALAPPSQAPVSPQQSRAVTISAEAQACFDWFSTLGYPDLKDAPWVEVSTQPALAISLFVHALSDTFNCFAQLDSFAGQSEASPRICDAALLALHRAAPGVYPFSPKASRGQRDTERINSANIWRREHHLTEIPLPAASAPKLTPADALRIVEINLVFPRMKPEKEFVIFAGPRHKQ